MLRKVLQKGERYAEKNVDAVAGSNGFWGCANEPVTDSEDPSANDSSEQSDAAAGDMKR